MLGRPLRVRGRGLGSTSTCRWPAPTAPTWTEDKQGCVLDRNMQMGSKKPQPGPCPPASPRTRLTTLTQG
eukprot:scaffold68_cov340-Pavlova_lutheri.AAC.15